ncbi:MAG: ATP-binding protein [Leptospiraceae bacterium]|nr:ATP-binding protein [Leptospiraceae bacterium]MCB1168961.1 ATP-binding protein [Leptospiraceae bacterium]
MANPAVVNALRELVQSGCWGNHKDFSAWLRFDYNLASSPDETLEALNKMAESGLLEKHESISEEFVLADVSRAIPVTSYRVSGFLKESPIQMVRSRLETFLRLHSVEENIIVDMSIATTEAMENAVKYNDQNPIDIRYSIEAGEFRIEIRNGIREVQIERDIEAGKYNSSLTLMRGMMVMSKLFDELDIEIKDAENLAVFTARKRVG